jgi:hypothetical protein
MRCNKCQNESFILLRVECTAKVLVEEVEQLLNLAPKLLSANTWVEF